MLQELIQFGLSEPEANTYLICLKTGQATANRIAELANSPRSTVYDILERLKNLGLISTCVIDNKTNFIANTPETLLVLINEKRDSIKNILPELDKMYKQVGEKPKTEVFQGKIAVLKLFDEILSNAKELYVIGSQGNALEMIGYHPEKFRIRRLERKIKIKQILEDSKEARSIAQDKYTEIKFLKSLSNSKEGTFVFDDYVYHIIFQYEISAIKIKSKDHADSVKISFDELWKTAKK